jgi:hypothetical protein
LASRRCIKEAQHAVALFGAGQIQRRLGQGVQPFGQANPLKGRGTGLDHHDGLGVGQADVFAGSDQHPPEDEARVLTGFHHPGQPEQGRIGIAAPQRLDEGTDRVEVGIALLVVQNRTLLNRFFGDGQVDRDHAVVIGRCGLNSELEGIEQAAGIATGHVDQVIDGCIADDDLAFAVAPLVVAQGPLQQLAQMLGFERSEPKQSRTTHQGLVDLKERVFGGRSDQVQRAVLDPGQQRVLLCTVEAVHLVDEQGAAQAVSL